jgi:hypothetical protein
MKIAWPLEHSITDIVLDSETYGLRLSFLKVHISETVMKEHSQWMS